MHAEPDAHDIGLGAKILAVVENGAWSVSEIVARLDAPESEVLAAIEELQDIGELQVTAQVSASSGGCSSINRQITSS